MTINLTYVGRESIGGSGGDSKGTTVAYLKAAATTQLQQVVANVKMLTRGGQISQVVFWRS